MDRQTNKQLDAIKQIIINKVDTEAIYLFGSYAYGIPKEDSDFDLYVVIPDDGIRPLEAAQILNNAIYESQRRPIDILVGKSSDFHKRKLLPTIEKMVARDGVMLYG